MNAPSTEPTRRAVAERCTAAGLSYWSDGPVTGTSWALDASGASVLVDNRSAERITADCECGNSNVHNGHCGYCGRKRTGTYASRKAAQRATELETAMRHGAHRVIYEASAYPLGVEAPARLFYPNAGPDGIAFVPFERGAGLLYSDEPFTAALVRRLSLYGY